MSPEPNSRGQVRLIVTFGNPGAGKTRLADLLLPRLGVEWRLIRHDKWIRDPEVLVTPWPG